MPTLTRDDIIKNLMTLNDPKKGIEASQNGDEVVIKHTLVDQSWGNPVGGPAVLKQSVNLKVSFDEVKHEANIRTQESGGEADTSTLTGSIGTSSLPNDAIGTSSEKVIHFGKDSAGSNTTGYKYNISELKAPVEKIIAEAGWSMKTGFLSKLFGKK